MTVLIMLSATFLNAAPKSPETDIKIQISHPRLGLRMGSDCKIGVTFPKVFEDFIPNRLWELLKEFTGENKACIQITNKK